MTSILLVPFHPPGHTEPMAALAGQLRAAGHEVTTFSEETASRWCPDAPIPPHLYTADSATLFRHIFLGDLEAMVRDIVDLAYECGAELIVADVMAAGGALAAQRIDLPWVSLSFSPVPALDSYRTFLPPHAVDSFAPHRVLAALGLPDDDVSLLGRTSPQLHLIPTTARFAGSHRLPDEVALVGPFAEVPPPRTRPAGRPVVVVSASTNAPISLGVRALVQDRYVATAVQALAGLPVDGLVTHGGAGLATGPVPDNVRLLGRTPHDELLDRASAVVTHAGWGTVCRALVRGLPLVLVPIFADQPYIATRCAELGLGIALDADTVTATELRDAVRAVVEEPRYRNAAQEVAGELRAMAPLATAADLITASLQPSEG